METNNIELKKCSTALIEVATEIVNLRNKPTSDNLPLLPEELPVLIEKLVKNDFSLVISGEVNRGKSTFINALIGENVLPTFDKETTSQVFKIKNSEREAYSVIYDNGDVLPIRKEELLKYGTQIGANDSSDTSKNILYIEVCTSIKSLPKGVTIIDTPGIGSTFKEHTEIAKEFMQQADAIIYLCSSKHPLVKVDIDFVKNTILPLPTFPNVLFVMAKADLADSDAALAEMIRRDEELLREQFREYPSIGKQILPVNSLSLIKAYKIDSPELSNALKQNSNFDAVGVAINNLIERQEFFWSVTVYNSIVKYYKKINQHLSKQLSDYDLDSQNRQEKINAINHNLQSLESDWGVAKQRDVLEKITNIINSFKADIREEFVSDKSSILKKYFNKVDSFSDKLSAEELNDNAQLLCSQILEDASSKWEEFSGTVISKVQSSLYNYSKQCQLKVDEVCELPQIDDDDFKVDLNITMSDRFDAMRGKYFTALFGVSIGTFALSALAASSSTVAAIVGTSSFLGPAGWIIGGGTLLYGLFYGNKKAKVKAVMKAKTEIKNHLKEMLCEIYNQLTTISLMNDKYESALKLFEKSIQENAMDTISNIYSRAKQELETARKNMLDSANEANRSRIVNQQTLWNGVAKKLQALTEPIKVLNNEFNIFS